MNILNDLHDIYLEMVAYNRSKSKKSYYNDIIDAIDIDDNDNDNDDNDYDDNWEKDLYGLDEIDDSDVAKRLQKQYEDAIGRTSSYRGDLYNHIISHSGLVFFDNRKESAVIGNLIKLENGSFFIISHFAPYSLRSGVALIKQLSVIDFPVVISVPDYQANQLLKSGFRKVGVIPQYFAGEMVMKNVMANDSADDAKLRELMSYYSN
jgi:hypothetical protein